MNSHGKPKAFLCHSSDDHELVLRLGKDLRFNGIDTWVDEWEIKPGDSLRRKIDEGIGNADYFLAILTKSSLGSEWVATELDAALVMKISGECTLVPIPIGIPDNEVPTTLRGLLYVRLDDYEEGVRKLVGLCHGVSEKPPLGEIPSWAQRTVNLSSLRLSPHAEKLAVLLNEKSINGIKYEPRITPKEIIDELGLNETEIALAASELEELGWVHLTTSITMGEIGFIYISPLPSLFIETDSYIKGWNPYDDAVSLASALVNTGHSSINIKQVDDILGWGPRRINPALYILDLKGVINTSKTLDSTYAFPAVIITPRTKLFVSQRI
ncbi:MAG: toll/interleukin-1 receptor domain-containing protein [Thermodesulfobacteriota bacterium]